MKQHGKLNISRLYSDVKVTVNEELEEKMKNVKSSPVKLEKAMKAIKNLDLERIRVMRSAK